MITPNEVESGFDSRHEDVEEHSSRHGALRVSRTQRQGSIPRGQAEGTVTQMVEYRIVDPDRIRSVTFLSHL